MVQSQNSSVEMTTKGWSYLSLGTYGDFMIGNKAFEFYNEKNKEDFIQIPWDQIDYVSASVLPGKKISRFAVFVKGGKKPYTFSTKDNKATLRAIREHVPADRLQRSPNFLDVFKAGLSAIGHKVTGKR